MNPLADARRLAAKWARRHSLLASTVVGLRVGGLSLPILLLSVGLIFVCWDSCGVGLTLLTAALAVPLVVIAVVLNLPLLAFDYLFGITSNSVLSGVIVGVFWGAVCWVKLTRTSQEATPK